MRGYGRGGRDPGDQEHCRPPRLARQGLRAGADLLPSGNLRRGVYRPPGRYRGQPRHRAFLRKMRVRPGRRRQGFLPGAL